MEKTITARIYGDSVMKGTIIDGAYRYHAVMENNLAQMKDKFGLSAVNLSRFGCTVKKGLGIVKKDVERDPNFDYALIEYGGNDSNFRWEEISVSPEGDYDPLTRPEEFHETYVEMIDELRAHGVEPVLMTLPPIDAERYLDFLERNGNDKKNVLKWLGDAQMIYRFHESYSDMIKRIAQDMNCLIVDVRSYFLQKRSFRDLICIDGLHPTEEGYKLVCQAFMDFISAKRGVSPA